MSESETDYYTDLCRVLFAAKFYIMSGKDEDMDSLKKCVDQIILGKPEIKDQLQKTAADIMNTIKKL